MSIQKLNELSQELTPDEKKNLLIKIRSSLNIDDKENSGLQGRKIQKAQIKATLQKELKQYSWFQKLILGIFSFFVGKDLEGALLHKKLNRLGAGLKAVHGDLIHLSLPTLTEKFGQRLYDLYFASHPLFTFFEAILQNPELIGSAVTIMIEDQIPSSKRHLTDLISESELEIVYRKSGDKGAVHKKLRDLIPGYIKTLPTDSLNKIFADLGVFYLLKPMIFFPFDVVFDQFGHGINGLPPTKYPHFREASLKRLTDDVEKLYFVLYLTQKISWRKGLLDTLYNELLQFPQFNRKTLHPSIQSLDGWNLKIEELINEAGKLFQGIQWKEIIRFAQNDPFYSFRFNLPKFDLKEAYQAGLTIRLAEELDAFFPQLRKKMIEVDKKALFQSQNTRFLEFYSVIKPVQAEAYDLPHYKYVDSLNLYYSFFTTHFVTHFLPFIQAISRTILQNQKVFLNGLLSVSADIESVKDLIKKFDWTLSPETDEGKEFSRLCQELDTKATSHKLYTTFIEKADKGAQGLMKQCEESLRKLSEIFESIGSSSTPGIVSFLKAPFILGGTRQILSEVLREKSQFLKQLIRLIKETLRHEGDA